jgi:small nuclear ribonucleoprotein (snRNP)-like protein
MTPVRSWLPLAVLAVCIGLFVTPPPARAQSISGYDWNDPVTLKLRDGRKLEGHYRGVLGAPDSDTPYADRYAAWRSDMDPAMSPVLGETLDVALKSGDTMSGTFHGFADAAVLLGSADSASCSCCRSSRSGCAPRTSRRPIPAGPPPRSDGSQHHRCA